MCQTPYIHWPICSSKQVLVGVTDLIMCVGAQSYLSLCNPWTEPARLLSPWDFPGKNTGVGCRFLLQGIIQTRGLNPRVLHWQAGSLPLMPPGKPSMRRYTNWTDTLTDKSRDLSRVTEILSLESGFEPRQHLTWYLLSITTPYFLTQERVNM